MLYTLFQPVNYTTFFLKAVTVPCKHDIIFKKINLMLLEKSAQMHKPIRPKKQKRELNNEYFDNMDLHALSMLLIEKPANI
jgi:hypothetical protein